MRISNNGTRYSKYLDQKARKTIHYRCEEHNE